MIAGVQDRGGDGHMCRFGCVVGVGGVLDYLFQARRSGRRRWISLRDVWRGSS